MGNDHATPSEAQPMETSNTSFEYAPQLTLEWGEGEDFPEIPPAAELHALKDALCSRCFDPNVVWSQVEALEICDRRQLEHPIKDRMEWEHWNTPLHRSLCCFDFKSARLLVQHGADVDLRNSYGWTPLQEALDRQSKEAVELLTQHGADLNKYEAEGELPLHMALASGNVDIFRLLVEAGADLSAASHFEWSILDLAVLARDQQAVNVLLLQHPELRPSPLPSKGSGDGPDMSAAAKDLLAVATSRLLLPPRELYKVYCHAVLSNPQPGATNFVDGVYQALYKVAGIIIPTTRETLCERCLTFQSRVTDLRCRALTETPSDAFEVHETREELEECAKSCRLCGLAADVWDHMDREIEGPEGFGRLEPPKDAPATSRMTFKLCDELLETRETVLIVQDSRSVAEPKLGGDSVAQNIAFVYHAFPESDTTTGSRQAMDVAREWLHQCRSSPGHALCQESYKRGDADKTLPARVLNLTEDGRDPHLMDGAAMDGPYCALSYCWGDVGTANTVTTREDLPKYMEGIPMETLPTFIQQSIQAARLLGFRYMWTDALCIIQDDDQDWDREASKMSHVYPTPT